MHSYCFLSSVFYDIVNGAVVAIDGVQHVNVDMCIHYIEHRVVGVDTTVVISFLKAIPRG